MLTNDENALFSLFAKGERFIGLMPDNLRDLARGRGVTAALGAYDAVDDGHADAGEVAEPDALAIAEDLRLRRNVTLLCCFPLNAGQPGLTYLD
jgi:hypothetical protein